VTAALFDAPDGWRRATLAAVCAAGGGDIRTGPFGSQLHAADYVDDGVPSVMPQNIGDNVIHLDGIARIGPADAHRLSRYLLAAGDIVYSRRGDVERRALVRGDQAGWLCGTGCLRIRPGGAVDSAYLSYYLGHPAVRRWIVRHAVGATMLNLNSRILGEVPVVVPPVEVQSRIAGLLGNLDEQIAVNERIAGHLDQLSQALFQKIFAGAPGRRGRLADLCETQYGYTAGSTGRAVGPRLLRVKDINKQNWINWPDVPYCEIPPGLIARYQLSRGDVVVARMADPGKSAIIEDDELAVFASYLVRLKAASLPHAYFVWGFLKSKAFQNHVIASKSGSVQPTMNAKVITSAELTIPPAHLIRQYHDAVAPLRAQLQANRQETTTLTTLRDALLPELLSGRRHLTG
jgi:type I restriction enzyme S subunit